MSKFKDCFDSGEAGEDLRNNVRQRISRDKKGYPQNSGYSAQKPKRKWKAPVFITAAVLAVIMVIPSYLMIGNAVVNPKYDFTKARQVKSESQLTTLLNKQPAEPVSISLDFGLRAKSSGNSFEADTAAPSAPSDSAAESSGGSGHSTTNVQVEGMDEGDLVKNDGKYIYRLSSLGFSITETNNGQLRRVSEIFIENFSPIEMYIRGTQLILIGGGYRVMQSYGIDKMMDGGYASCLSYHTVVEIRVFDLTVIEEPEETFYYEIEGNYHTSRISEETGMLYFVVNYYYYNYNYDNYDEKAGEKRPYFKDAENASPQPLPLEDIYYFKNSPNKSYMVLGAVDLGGTGKGADVKAYLSYSGITYVSGESLYSSTQQWFYGAFGNMSYSVSYIAKFSLSDLSYQGSNSVKGAPKDRYCIDEYNGYLRVATSYGSWVSGGINTFANAVYVFDKDMGRVSRVMGIAEGEAIDSASFSGNRGYISTSVRMMDPLFIIDFSDVKNPQVSKGLKESGVNNYLKAIEDDNNDKNYVIGLGTDSAANTNGWNERTGIKTQLYDMSGEEAVSRAKLTIAGRYAYAEALYNPKAILYMYNENTKKGYFGFAAEAATYEYDNYYYYSYRIRAQGFYLYEFDTAAGTMAELGLLSNFDTGKDVYNYSYDENGWNWEEAQDRYFKYIQRGIVIDGYIYTVSPAVIKSYTLAGLTYVSQLAG